MRSRCCRPDCERSGAGATQQGAQATSCVHHASWLSVFMHVYPILSTRLSMFVSYVSHVFRDVFFHVSLLSKSSLGGFNTHQCHSARQNRVLRDTPRADDRGHCWNEELGGLVGVPLSPLVPASISLPTTTTTAVDGIPTPSPPQIFSSPPDLP